MDYQRPLYVVKPWRMQKRLLFPLYDVVLEALHFDVDKPDELLICRLHPPYLTMRVAHPERIMPLNAFSIDALPPAWPPVKKAGVR